MGWLLWCSVVAVLVAAVVAMIRAPKTGSGAASLTAMHDLQPKDKQAAIESIIESKSGHRLWIQRTAEPNEGTKE